MENKQQRIFRKLREAKSKGVLITDIFHDTESSKVIDTTLSRLRKFLGGKDTVIVENGKWYLSDEYVNMSELHFREKIRDFQLQIMMVRHETVNKRTLRYGIGLLIVLCLLSYLLGFFTGIPTIEEIPNIYPELQCQHQN